MRVDILTLFPAMFPPVLSESILRIAQEKRIVECHVHDLRPFGAGSRRNVDDRPYGGGPGMVMTCGPVFQAVEEIEREAGRAHRILTSPQGRLLTNDVAVELAAEPRLLIVCGHYEGYDERIPIGLEADEISIGDYVLTGGELAAMVIVDAVGPADPGRARRRGIEPPRLVRAGRARVSSVHAAAGVPRHEGARGAALRRSRQHCGVARGAGPASHGAEEARSPDEARGRRSVGVTRRNRVG